MTSQHKQYFERSITDTLVSTVKSFPITLLTGPRQSGKTTLLRHCFPKYEYVSLENPDTLMRIKSDIRGFLSNHKPRIIDEAQNLPELFSYLQAHVDEYEHNDSIILSGSQNFLLLEKTSQTLAGRAAVLELLPLTYHEYKTHKNQKDREIWDFLYHGTYPRPYQENLNPDIWFNSYIRTYLERDVRSLLNIKELSTFQRFLHLCAGRHGQLLNMNALANETGISQPTIKHWISILEASYIIFRLQPYYKNYNKRIVKAPKLYFYDPAIVCHLLGIESPDHLQLHSARGAIFEGFIISEILKKFLNKGKAPPLYFWRDKSELEIDLIIASGENLTAVEIKSSQTFNPNFLSNMKRWKELSGINTSACRLVYGGRESFTQEGIKVSPWDDADE